MQHLEGMERKRDGERRHGDDVARRRGGRPNLVMPPDMIGNRRQGEDDAIKPASER